MIARSHVIILSLIGLLLFGYTVGNKGFAYIGIGDVYIGELVLASCGAFFAFSPNFRAIAGNYVSLPFFLLSFICLLRTVPMIDDYGIFALRDCVIYGYMLFAILIAGCMSLPTMLLSAVRIFEYGALVAVPMMFLMLLIMGFSVDETSEGRATLLKPGDTSVHLTGVLSYFLLRLGREFDPNDHSWPTLMFRLGMTAAAAIAVFLALWCASTSRGALLAMLLGLATLFAWGFSRKMLMWVAVCAALVLTVSVALDLRVEYSYREISARQVVANFISIFDRDTASIVGSEIDTEALGSTASWRIDWWSDIMDYTFFGDLFWTGRGFGPNLATIDGYQVDPNDALRSPHNAHMTFLARAGVPGFVLWITSQVVFGIALVVSGLRMRRIKAYGWLRLNVWIMAYWLAALTNASFDVYLEGPQGGIWFWSIIGFGMALMYWENEAYRIRKRPVNIRPLAAIE